MADTAGTNILIGTRKGAFVLSSDANRQEWSLSEPTYLGHIIYHFVSNGTTCLMAAKTGHLGPTVFRSADHGATWTEAASPPGFSCADRW